MANLDDASLLQNLTARERTKLTNIARPGRYAGGETIIAMGQSVKHLFVLMTGSVRVMVPVDGQTIEEQTLATLSPGDVFAEFAFVDRQPSSAAVVAAEDTTVLELPHIELDELLDDDTELARKLLRDLLRMIVSRFRSTDANLALAHYVDHLV